MARRKRGSRTKAVAIAFTIFLAISFLGVIAVLRFGSEPEVTIVGCPVDESYINTNIAILFDTTEPMAISQSIEIENKINAVISNLEPYDRVSFYEVRSNERSGIRKVVLALGESDETIDHFCRRPVSWDDSPARARLYEQLPRLISTELQQTIEQGEQNTSPITDALRFIASDVSSKTYKTRLIVVSDMIEHSNTLSMYRSGWFESGYLANRQLVLSQRPIFPDGTSIEIYLLNRPNTTVQDENLQQYWVQMLTGAGAYSTIRLTFNFISGGL